jgi:hypothetical protein
MTLAELRARFWWLGPNADESYIVALVNGIATVKVIQCTWNRHTQKYEESVELDFKRLGLRVTWQPFWSDKLQEQLDKAREVARKAGLSFDKDAFINSAREHESRCAK